MTPIVENIMAQIDALTPEERVELTYAILRNCEPCPEIEAEWQKVVERRWKRVKEENQQGTPAAELFAKLRER